MRTIGFRAWDGENKRMVFWTLNDLLCRFGEDEYREERENCSPFFEWMQYTGLKDKNGKEIYEGDIVRADERAMPEVVEWTTGERCEEWGCTVEAGFVCEAWHGEPIEVIGNRYENPELLKTN